MYYKGMVFPEYIGCPQTIRFDLVEETIVMLMSRENIEKYPLSGAFEFKFEPIYNTIFLLMRYGNCPWMSAPYSPHLSQFKAKAFPKGEGLPLTILQVCNEDGKLHNMSFVVLMNDFSNRLYCAADMIFQTIPFSLEEHKKVIAAVYNKYSTDEELADACEEGCFIP